MNIVVVAGTNRTGSRTRSIAGAIMNRYAGIAGVTVQLLDLATLPLDLLSPEAYGTKPAAFAPFAEAVLASDGLHIVTPEYNGGMPGALKLFIDHLPFPESFERRPVCFTGVAAGRWGALRPIEQLQGVFGYRNAYQLPDRVFISGATKALGEDGWPVEPHVSTLLAAQVTHFVQFCEAVKPLR
ncbi:MAG: NAD(P)H-dependent oxidoreductase [Myxococcota bacterium]|nr:NAD(P)H-dependent oxidoreductase [Myxococcota bacterium]